MTQKTKTKTNKKITAIAIASLIADERQIYDTNAAS